MPVKTGYDHGIYDTALFDEMPEVTQFEDSVKARYNLPRIRFVFDDTIYDTKVLAAPTISRNADITAGSVQVELTNTDGAWNIFITNRANIGKTCAVGLYFAPATAIGLLYLFTGTVEGVRYTDASVILTLRDKMAPLLKKEVGSGQVPLDFFSTWYYPDTLAWAILTNYGELSNLTSTENPDIDYASWQAWGTACVAKGFGLEARFTGQKIRTILTEIGRLTNSLIWVDGLGRFNFKMFDPPYSGVETLTRTNCKVIDLDIDNDGVWNDVRIYFGYDPVPDQWDNSTNDVDNTSIGRYGRRQYVEEGKIVWHRNTASAVAYRDDFLDLWAYPREKIILTATMIGVLCDLGAPVYITESLKDFTNRPYWIDNVVSLNIETGLVQLEGLYAG